MGETDMGGDESTISANLEPIDREIDALGERFWSKMMRDFTCVGINGENLNMDRQIPAIDNLLKRDDTEHELYFYHGDHLGSSSYITDINGDATQHMQYLPFGEDFIHEQNATSYYTPYTFSAKEKDIETGYSYFGARYYSPELSVWLSVDPLSDDYPHQSPYAYCSNNPVMRIDPTGMNDDWIENPDGNIVWDANVTGANNTPAGSTYIGKSDNDIVKHLYGKNTFSTSTIDMGSFGINDFDNKNVKGAAHNNVTARTNMDVTLSADVSTVLNSDGSVKTKEFNGINVFANITGTVAPMHGPVDGLQLSPELLQVNGSSAKRVTGSSSFMSPNRGNVPRINYSGFISSNNVSNSSGLNINFKGTYQNNGVNLAPLGIFSVIGQRNTTNIQLNIPRK